MRSNYKRSSNLLRSTIFWQPVTDVFLLFQTLSVFQVSWYIQLQTQQWNTKLKTVMTCITDAVITRYEVIHFGVTAIVIGKYVNAYRRAAISPLVPGAQYKITA